MSGYCTDVSQFAVKGVKSISFPMLTSFTAAERGTGVTLDSQAITSSVDTLDLNVPAYIKWRIDVNDEIQSTLNWELETVSRASAAHGRYFDAKIHTAALAAAKECSLTGLTKANILEGREYIKTCFGDINSATLFVSAAGMGDLLGIDEFTRADIFGSPVIGAGVIGKLYGMNVVETNGLSGEQWYISTKEAIVYGFQREPAYGEEGDIDLGVGAKKRVLDCLYGVKAVQIAQGGASAGESPFIFKYNAV
jgi:hypothetical protein